MANQEHLDVLQQGVEAWNQWRKEHRTVRPDLKGAHLNQANLSKADLSGADLFEAFLYYKTNLTNANLSQANLIRANLRGADLTNANLSGANLSETILSEANLGNVNFAEAFLSGTVFAENDLSAVKGLTEIDYRGPSRVELYTVKLPLDGSALHFLRGIGVPNAWIEMYRNLLMSPIRYHSCFICYAHQDEPLVRRLYTDLQDQGVRCWFAPEDLKIGDKIRTRIDEAIHLHEMLLLLLSEHSIASSWVEDEVEAALEKEQRQHREILFPVHLDEQVMKTGTAWAATLRRTRHIGDFTRWTEPQAYQRAFERLLRDLKAENTTKGDEAQ